MTLYGNIFFRSPAYLLPVSLYSHFSLHNGLHYKLTNEQPRKSITGLFVWVKLEENIAVQPRRAVGDPRQPSFFNLDNPFPKLLRQKFIPLIGSGGRELGTGWTAPKNCYFDSTYVWRVCQHEWCAPFRTDSFVRIYAR